ncbi:MAG: cytochrome P450 [Paracoccaceae bacterium]
MLDPDFNAMTSPAFRADPYPILARMREDHPVAHLSPGLIDSWHILRYDDVRSVLLDTETFSSNRSLVGGGKLDDANLGFLFNNLISATGNKHRRLRMIGNRVFMPKFIESFRPVVQAVVDERMEMALDTDEFDLIEDFAAEITVAMVCAILGVPRSDKEQIRRWSAVLGENSGASTWLAQQDAALIKKGRDTGIALTDYFRDTLRTRRANPREGDLISAFMSVEVEGEKLSDSEVLSMAMLLLLAGNESTTNLIGNFIRVLATQPDVDAALRANPDLISSAVEETLRMRNSIRNVDRIATRDIEMRGVTIPKGGLVVVWLSAANRDPAAFEHPDSFIADRKPNRHMGFGQGIHLCLGAPLARMEAQIVGKAIIERISKIELTGPPILGPNANFDSITRQMARFHAK